MMTRSKLVKALIKLYGYSKEDFKGMNLEEIQSEVGSNHAFHAEDYVLSHLSINLTKGL